MITATGTISFGSTLTVNGKVDRVQAGDTTAVLDSGLRLYSDGTVSFADNVTLANGNLYLWAKTSVSMVAGKSIATNGNHVFLGNTIPTLTNLQLNLTGFAADGTTATDGKFYFTAFSAGDANGNSTMSTVTLPIIPASNPSGLTFAVRTPTQAQGGGRDRRLDGEWLQFDRDRLPVAGGQGSDPERHQQLRREMSIWSPVGRRSMAVL